MLRDTFAIEMLLAGVPLEQVSILLGHKSAKITEKHYAPWVKARQEQLSTSIRKAWRLLEVGKPSSKLKKAMAARTLGGKSKETSVQAQLQDRFSSSPLFLICLVQAPS